MISFIRFWAWVGLILYGCVSIYALTQFHKQDKIVLGRNGVTRLNPGGVFGRAFLAAAICASVLYFIH